MTTETAGVTATTEKTPRTREESFILRLYAARHGGGTAPLRRWRPGTVDAGVVAVTRDATELEFPAWALTGKLFVLTNRSAMGAWSGAAGHGVGRWAFWAKPRRSGGEPDRQAERLIASLCRADSFDDVAALLTSLARMTTNTLPDWTTVLSELVEWSDHSTRDAVRYRWARDFYTPSKPSAGEKTETETETDNPA